jgi:hypothetical protein
LKAKCQDPNTDFTAISLGGKSKKEILRMIEGRNEYSKWTHASAPGLFLDYDVGLMPHSSSSAAWRETVDFFYGL